MQQLIVVLENSKKKINYQLEKLKTNYSHILVIMLMKQTLQHISTESKKQKT
jgi:hypothetical protein